MSLGEQLFRLRTEKKLSQEELAAILGVSRQSISKWETDASTPELDKLVKLSGVFEITLDELVLGTPPVPAPAPPPTPESTPPEPTPQTPLRKITGILLLFLGGLLGLLLTLMGGFFMGLALALFFFLLGAICLLARRRAWLWCAWTVFLSLDLFLRFATGLNWRTIFWTLRWTPEMNYVRLAIAWVQFLSTLAVLLATVISFRKLPWARSPRHQKLLVTGWVLLVLAHLPLISKGPFSLWFGLVDDVRITLLATVLTFTARYVKTKEKDGGQGC